MKVKSDICYDAAQDVLRGPHVNVQVIIIRSLTGNWKQPVYYQFDQSVTVELFFECVKLIEESGFRMRAFVSDMGGPNRKLGAGLNLSPQSSYIANPSTESRKIWAFYDVPHLLKLARNHLLEEGFSITFKEQVKQVSKGILFDLVNKQKEGDLKYAYKITEHHLLVSGSERQNVRKAAELLSRTVAKAVSYNFPGNDHVVDFINTINDGFDVLNSRLPHHPTNKLKSAYGTSLQDQDVILNKLYDLCYSARVIGKKEVLPFQIGFMVSIRSLQGLFNELEAEGYKYLLSAKCNQDVLESYFSLIRGFGKFYDHPLPTAVTHRIKYLLFSKSACDILKTGNCIAEQCETLSVDVLKKIDLAKPVQDFETSDWKEDKLEVNDVYNEEFISIAESLIGQLTEITNNKLVYPEENTDLLKMLAGYVAYRVNKKGLKTDFQYGGKTGNSNSSDWVSVLSRGGLINPSSKWLSIVLEFEKDFHRFHGDGLNNSPQVMKKLIDIIKRKFNEVDDFAITTYVRTRSFIRMKELNKKKELKRAMKKDETSDTARKKSKKMNKIKN